MTYEEGFKVTSLKELEVHGLDKSKVATAACALFAELMFVHGFCYADCHPGNVLVRPRGHSTHGEFDIVLLDHGMYRRLDERFRSGYCNLWAGLVSGNEAQALCGLGALGLHKKYLDIMGLLLTYRIPLGVSFANLLKVAESSPHSLHFTVIRFWERAIGSGGTNLGQRLEWTRGCG